MDGSVRAIALALAVLAFASARAHIASHDNILRIQLWDAEGLSRDPITTPAPVTTMIPRTTIKRHKLKVNLDSLYEAMLEEGRDGGFGRFTRHKVRHKRRWPRQTGSDLPWRFHAGDQVVNVAVYDVDVPWDVIEADNTSVYSSAVSDSGSSPVNGSRNVAPPMLLRQPEDEEEEVKELPVVPKCCPSGQNFTVVIGEDGNIKTNCSRSMLTFQPLFHEANVTHIFSYDSNVYETIVGNPCKYDKYRLQPDINSQDEFYLLVNGSLFVPYSNPSLLGTKDYCMETFWNESVPAGITLPVVCFPTPVEDTKTSSTLIAYATGLLISVPFLLATAFVYLSITELRDTHGKALACHTVCLALAFSCLAATQLAGHAFPTVACTIMAYLIQFSFVSCFFWLNVMCFDIFLNVRYSQPHISGNNLTLTGPLLRSSEGAFRTACTTVMLLTVPTTERYINSSVTRRSMRRRFAWYCVYAVIFPILLLAVTIVMDLSPAVPSTYLKPNFGVKGCWFKTDQAALPYFYGPVALILFGNLCIFFFTSRALATHYDKLKDLTSFELTHSDFSTSDDWVRLGTVLGQPLPVNETTSTPPREGPSNFNQRLKKYKKLFRKCCLLSFIMGLSWVLEVVSWAVGAGTDVVSVWSVFDLINALQGVVIFAIFVLQQPVRSLVKASHLFKSCNRNKDGSEVSVVSETNSIIGAGGRRDYV